MSNANNELALAPAYVPGLAWDVFISYAHASKAWTVQFKTDLENKLEEKMAPAPKVWMDDSNLRKAGDYPEDLTQAVSNSALLLTVNSEPYLYSSWCDSELNEFRRKFGEDPRTSDRGRRIVEVYQNLRPDGSPPKVQEDSEGVWFCDKQTGDAFVPKSVEYELALRYLVKEIGKRLLSMRKERRSVFLSPPVDAVDQASTIGRLYRKLRTELEQDYRVVPLPVGPTLSDDEELVKSSISVHFLSQKYDKKTMDRIKKASAADRPVLVIIAPELNPNNPIIDFLVTLQESLPKDVPSLKESLAKDVPSKIQVFNWIPARHQSKDVTSLVDRVVEQQEQPPPASKFSIYLICDPRDIKEDEVKGLLRVKDLFKIFEECKDFEQIKNLEKIKKATLNEEELMALFAIFEQIRSLVLTFELPRSAQNTPEGVQDHIGQLAICDGLLLLWGCAEEAWFQKYHDELPTAPGFRAGRPLYSKAVLIKPSDEKKTAFAKKLFGDEDLWEGINMSKLARFLSDLVAAKQAYSTSK